MTATVIDALLVTLGLDSTQYDENSKRILEEMKKFRDQNVNLSKTVTESNRRTTDSFRSLKNELVGLAAAYFGLNAIKRFIQDNVNGQAELSRTSRNLDISTRRLEAWGTIAEEMGGKATDSFSALQSVASGIAEATIRGHSALTDAARANGVALTDQQGKLLSSEEILLRFSARMAELPRQQAIALANMAGLGGLSNELLLGPEELRRRIDDAERLSRVTQESARHAEELQRRWADVRLRLRGIGERVFEKLEPVLERITNQLVAWVDNVNWDRVIEQASKLASQIDDVAQQFGGWKTVAAALAVVLGAQLLSPLLAIVGAVAKLGGLLPGVVGGMSSLGSAAGGVALSATGAAAVGVAAAVYSPALGGAKRADGSYNDEVPVPEHAKHRFTNDELWDSIQAKKSPFVGTPYAAAYMLAERSYIDKMDPKVYDEVARDILTGKIDESTAWLANSKRNPVPAPGSIPSNGVSGASSPALAAEFAALEAKNGLPAGILDRVWKKESARGTGPATSSAGAQGPFQFMPGTAADYGLAGNDVNDVHKSAAAAAQYLGDLHKQFGGNTALTLAAYNWGPGNLTKKGLANAPAETQDYVKLAQGLSIGPQAGYRPQPRSSTSNSEINIDKIEVHTQATDAQGIAAALPGALRQRGIVEASNTGVE